MPARSDGRDRLVFLHGFTQSHHHWHRCAHLVARDLGTDPALAFVDLPGHGLSSDERLPISQSGPPLAALVGAGTLIGYSMGARFALHAALAAGSHIERLVIIGGTAGIDDPDERAQRRATDEARATRIERVGVDAFLDEWLAAPMFEHVPHDPAGLDHRRRNTSGGLAASLRDAGTGAMDPLWARLHGIEIPVLILAGERDDKFSELGRRIAAAMPDATFAVIPAAGHASHIERPEATAAAIAGWLTELHRIVA